MLSGRAAFWVSVSLVLHAALFALLGLRSAEPPAPPPSDLWMEAATPEVLPPPPEPPPPPPPPPPDVQRAPAPARKVARAPSLPKREPAPPEPKAPEVTAPVVDDESSVAVQEGDGRGAIGSTGGKGDGMGTASAGGADEAQRKAGPAQLSFWLDVPGIERLALSRPTIALLMAVPGYSEILRGSGIRPLVDLQRVRVRISGLAPERLLVAGVHSDGEGAVVSAAERIAAMRDQVPEWRGGDAFKATAWVDGSEADRGLALHGGSFVIAPRKALPEVLGAKATQESVHAVSRLRERMVALIAIEDAPRYLPGVQACGLQALRISFADGGSGPRMTLAAHYETASLASDGGGCLGEHGAQMPTLTSWLARAQGKGSGSSVLTLEVTSSDIEKLLGELAWALRSARRA